LMVIFSRSSYFQELILHDFFLCFYLRQLMVTFSS